MAINENDRAHAFRIDPPPAGVFDPRLAAMEMGAFHKTDEAFALEVTGGPIGGAFFVRTEKPRSAVVSYLSLACGTAAVPAHEDWLTLRPDETALVRCLTLTHHTVLPTVGYSEQHVRVHWATILGHMNATTERFGGRYGVRILLQRASDAWHGPFEKELANRSVPGAGAAGSGTTIHVAGRQTSIHKWERRKRTARPSTLRSRSSPSALRAAARGRRRAGKTDRCCRSAGRRRHSLETDDPQRVRRDETVSWSKAHESTRALAIDGVSFAAPCSPIRPVAPGSASPVAGPVEHIEARGGRGASDAAAGSRITSGHPAGLPDNPRTSSQRTPGNRRLSPK